MRLLLDTNICIEILRGKDSALLARYASQVRADLALSAIVRSELIAGALLSVKTVENRQIAEDFCALFPCLPFDAKAADIHAEWHARLRRAGTLIGTHDLMIAATALAHGLTVVTRNTDEFQRIEMLAIEDWRG
ncbi:MAG: type II toxin-antitoxin system VapC family toxin [Rhodocyclaceae bacterium]|nr:type II toxin-antitoxin system VapC family toxin [Rhodocyclaceae bacterium]MDZ4213250.1 type II toxin-antitoxin system VapC family toxin [Rhodocyclaceae bacterium]